MRAAVILRIFPQNGLLLHSHDISLRVSELLAECDAANVLILPTFSVPLMTHGRTAFVQDDAWTKITHAQATRRAEAACRRHVQTPDRG